MDDMLIFAQSKAELNDILNLIEVFLENKLQLSLKPTATQLAPITEGISFLGFRIYPNLKRLQAKSLRRFRQRLRAQEWAYQTGEIDSETLTASVQSMIAHMRHADTLKLRQALLSSSLALG